MQSTQRNIRSNLLILISIFIFPIICSAQSEHANIKALHREINSLSNMLTQLKAEQHRAQKIGLQIESPSQDYTIRDSLRLVDLKRKQSDSRAKIDELTLEIIKISKQLEDPGKRYALAKKIQNSKMSRAQIGKHEILDSSSTFNIITARSIDLAAVKLVRGGKSLDQARLLTIDELSSDQVLTFYRDLPKTSRYELYDIADEIAISEDMALSDARRSAIYFYLFTK